jgi:leucyl aminopeptidase
LAQELQQAGEQSLDRVWRMPVMEEYQELLDSPLQILPILVVHMVVQ